MLALDLAIQARVFEIDQSLLDQLSNSLNRFLGPVQFYWRRNTDHSVES